MVKVLSRQRLPIGRSPVGPALTRNRPEAHPWCDPTEMLTSFPAAKQARPVQPPPEQLDQAVVNTLIASPLPDLLMCDTRKLYSSKKAIPGSP